MKTENKAHFRRKPKTQPFDKMFSKLYTIFTPIAYRIRSKISVKTKMPQLYVLFYNIYTIYNSVLGRI